MLPLSLRLLSFTRDVLLVRDEKYGGFILAPVWCGGVLMLGMRGDVTSSRNSMHSSVMVDVAGNEVGLGSSSVVTRIMIRISRSELVKLMDYG